MSKPFDKHYWIAVAKAGQKEMAGVQRRLARLRAKHAARTSCIDIGVFDPAPDVQARMDNGQHLAA